MKIEEDSNLLDQFLKGSYRRIISLGDAYYSNTMLQSDATIPTFGVSLMHWSKSKDLSK